MSFTHSKSPFILNYLSRCYTSVTTWDVHLLYVCFPTSVHYKPNEICWPNMSNKRLNIIYSSMYRVMNVSFVQYHWMQRIDIMAKKKTTDGAIQTLNKYTNTG